MSAPIPIGSDRGPPRGALQHSQLVNLQAESGVLPAPQQASPPQSYGPYATSPSQQQAYSPGPSSAQTPAAQPTASPPSQQQFHGSYPNSPPRGPLSASPQQRPHYGSQGSGYFSQQRQQISYADADPNNMNNLHPSHAEDYNYASRPGAHVRHSSYSSNASHRSNYSHASRRERASHGSHGSSRPTSSGGPRRSSMQNERLAKHRDDDADSVVYESEDDEDYDAEDAHGRRHSYGGSQSAYNNQARRRRGSHRSEADIQREKDAIEKRPTLGDSMLLMYDTLKGAISGRRS